MVAIPTSVTPSTSPSITPEYPKWVDVADHKLTLGFLKQAITAFSQQQREQFKAGDAVEALLFNRSHYIDQLLQRLWLFYGFSAAPHRSLKQTPLKKTFLEQNHIALIAVGGYGRNELHPLSDIDILILSDHELDEQQKIGVSNFITMLWDLKLTVSHSVRTLNECLDKAKDDLTIMTNLIESRLILGDISLFDALKTAVFNEKIWPIFKFYQAKRTEQQDRHLQYHSTSHKLEPDLKNSPGGLRDIHTLQWVALRYFRFISIEDMLKTNTITEEEYLELVRCRTFLWRIRFALHLSINHYDNRLLFDRQLSIAQLLNYKGEGNQPVEDMMKDYYRTVHHISELNELLLQVFEEKIEEQTIHHPLIDFNEHYYLKNHRLLLKNPLHFTEQPEQIIALFFLLAAHSHIQGIHSSTLRHLRLARRYLKQFDSFYISEIPQARHFFMAILRHPNGIYRAILPMYRYGILSSYLPGWKHIAGLMQFDLFHIYTVDEHTLRVLLKIAQFADKSAAEKHPICTQVYQKLQQPEILLIGALFHDIAKGKKGDHSELGAIEVEKFAILHGLNKKETHDVIWLVKNHLLMSIIAQKRDIQDPEVIKKFAEKVRNKKRLCYLLCLTVSDVCATNETLWNSWKQTLIRQLFFATMKLYDVGQQHMPGQRSIIRQNKADALKILHQHNIDETKIRPIWAQCRADYFYRHNANQLAWHAENLLKQYNNKLVVLITSQATHGGTEIFIYTPDRPFLFALVSQELDNCNLNIHSAQIFTNKEAYAMDTFIVLDPMGQPVSEDRYARLKSVLEKAINHTEYKPKPRRRLSSKLRYFHVATQINFLPSEGENQTYVELIALDRPGLLATIAQSFALLGLSLKSAKIATIGERVEDLFILTDANRQALSDELCEKLRQYLTYSIEQMDKT